MTLENLRQALLENNLKLLERLSHNNKDVLDLLGDNDGTLLYNGEEITGEKVYTDAEIASIVNNAWSVHTTPNIWPYGCVPYKIIKDDKFNFTTDECLVFDITGANQTDTGIFLVFTLPIDFNGYTNLNIEYEEDDACVNIGITNELPNASTVIGSTAFNRDEVRLLNAAMPGYTDRKRQTRINYSQVLENPCYLWIDISRRFTWKSTNNITRISKIYLS